MWRDLRDDEIKYLNKIVDELKRKIKFHGIIMIISYVIMILIFILSNSIKINMLFELVEFLAINPFMWIFVYVVVNINHQISCLSEKGYTKCADVKILELIPEDSSKNTNWFANVKFIENDELREKVPCYNGDKIQKIINQKGLYSQGIMIELTSNRKKDKKDLKEEKREYLIYDLTSL